MTPAGDSVHWINTLIDKYVDAKIQNKKAFVNTPEVIDTLN